MVSKSPGHASNSRLKSKQIQAHHHNKVVALNWERLGRQGKALLWALCPVCWTWSYALYSKDSTWHWQWWKQTPFQCAVTTSCLPAWSWHVLGQFHHCSVPLQETNGSAKACLASSVTSLFCSSSPRPEFCQLFPANWTQHHQCTLSCHFLPYLTAQLLIY